MIRFNNQQQQQQQQHLYPCYTYYWRIVAVVVVRRHMVVVELQQQQQQQQQRRYRCHTTTSSCPSFLPTPPSLLPVPHKQRYYLGRFLWSTGSHRDITTDVTSGRSNICTSTTDGRTSYSSRRRRNDRRYYHELSYHSHGKPYSCINYNSTTVTATTSTTKSPTTSDLHVKQSFDNDVVVAVDAKDVLFQEYNDSFSTKDEQQQQQQQQRRSPSPQQWVYIEMIAAPYNPADALSIQGNYPNPYTSTMQNYDYNNYKNPYETIAQISRRSSCVIPSSSDDDNDDDDSGYTTVVPGSEGWGRVIDVVSNDNHCTTTVDNDSSRQQPPPPPPQQQQQQLLQIGDYIVMGQPGLGTYRSHMWVPSTSVIKLHRGLELYNYYGPTRPAPLFQTAGTAIRMLRDYYNTNIIPSATYTTTDNDGTQHDNTISIVQNAGNSAVGLMLSQIATNIMKWQCTSIIRSNPRTSIQMDALVHYMMEYGNPTQIITEERIREAKDDVTKTLSPLEYDTRNVVLGFNGVGGDSIQTIIQMMAPTDGTIVTYGNMSKQSHMTINPSHLIFRNIHFTGFWYSRWMVQQQYQQYAGRNVGSSSDTTCTIDARAVMMNELVDFVLSQKLKCPPVLSYPLSDYKNAFQPSNSQQNIKSKVVFDCRENVK